MKRFVLSLPEELFVALQRRARERGVSIATVLREAAEKDVSPEQPWPLGVGEFRSGHPDTSWLAGEESAQYDDGVAPHDSWSSETGSEPREAAASPRSDPGPRDPRRKSRPASAAS